MVLWVGEIKNLGIFNLSDCFNSIGQLTSLDAEIRQSINRGIRLGQIDMTTGFKIRAGIDEHYISRIYVGLKGTFSLSNKDYNLSIKKVYTQVTGGPFQVHMVFDGKIIEDIRRGQTLQIRLAVQNLSNGQRWFTNSR